MFTYISCVLARNKFEANVFRYLEFNCFHGLLSANFVTNGAHFIPTLLSRLPSFLLLGKPLYKRCLDLTKNVVYKISYVGM